MLVQDAFSLDDSCLFLHKQKGADVAVLDMDGNFAIDHATEGSYAHVIMQEHLKKSSEYKTRAKNGEHS